MYWVRMEFFNKLAEFSVQFIDIFNIFKEMKMRFVLITDVITWVFLILVSLLFPSSVFINALCVSLSVSSAAYEIAAVFVLPVVPCWSACPWDEMPNPQSWKRIYRRPPFLTENILLYLRFMSTTTSDRRSSITVSNFSAINTATSISESAACVPLATEP